MGRGDFLDGGLKYVYVAAGWFQPGSLERLENVEAVLNSCGLRLFSPRKELLFEPGKTTPKEVLDANMNALKKVDFCVAITDDKDVGMLVEVGICIALGIPLVLVWLTGAPEQKFNIMLAGAGRVARSLKELEEIIMSGELFGVDAHEGQQYE